MAIGTDFAANTQDIPEYLSRFSHNAMPRASAGQKIQIKRKLGTINPLCDPDSNRN